MHARGLHRMLTDRTTGCPEMDGLRLVLRRAERARARKTNEYSFRRDHDVPPSEDGRTLDTALRAVRLREVSWLGVVDRAAFPSRAGIAQLSGSVADLAAYSCGGSAGLTGRARGTGFPVRRGVAP